MSVMDEPRPQSRGVKVQSLREFTDDPEGRWCDSCAELQPRGCAFVVYLGWSRSEICVACKKRLDAECGDEAREQVRMVTRMIQGCHSCRTRGVCEIHLRKLEEVGVAP